MAGPNLRGGVTAGTGFSSNTVAIIVMAGGLLGLFASSLFWSSVSPYRWGGTVVRGYGRAARGRRQRAASPASGQDNLGPLSRLDRRYGWARAASRFLGEPARGVRLEVMSVLYRY
jgi:hypothetical protein